MVPHGARRPATGGCDTDPVNRLAGETSPYLLQHADNPVDWYPWGEEAFARARAEARPVLLSVGYSACHWCHVMAHESFEDPDTAALMNERFVSVKVDREERPDVDAIYMGAVVALSGQGGWPLTAFLTPAGEPYWGGTYFPPEPRHGLPAFRQVLDAMARVYAERPGDVAAQAAQLVEAIRRSAAAEPSREPLTESLLANAVVTLGRLFDAENGGFGGAPKFPPSAGLEFLLRAWRRTGDERALGMATTTLDRMAAGGIYDQLGGGFHRYAVDAIWLVPHFEKMLYDNALLASVYLHGWLATGTPRYREVACETLDYLLRELRLPGGGFASAQDADTLGREGLTYVWTREELAAVLGPEDAELAAAHFGATPSGNFEGTNVLHVAADPPGQDGRLPALRRALLEARDRRPQPARDDKVLAAWNGLALAALAEAGARLERPDYTGAARELAEFLLGAMIDGRGRLLRAYRIGEARIPGYLDDYAHVASGLLELHVATGELRYLEESRRLAGLAVELFADTERGGFFFTAADGERLVVRTKELDDNPVPSGSSMLATVLVRLARIYGDDELERLAVGCFRIAHRLLERAPGAVGQLLSALDLHFAPPREVAIVGRHADPATLALRRAALERFSPTTVHVFTESPGDPVADRVALLAGRGLVDGRPAAYVCERFACRAPITDPDVLREALAT
ncbi:MAG: thioredoxin domain-containing protein [Thermoleophilia bacterium]|nr:thioredoxin domain-containing protein [Thermoleophilia bacterium]